MMILLTMNGKSLSDEANNTYFIQLKQGVILNDQQK